MNRTFDRTQLGRSCLVCSKRSATRLNRPHSLKRTRGVVKANIQTRFGVPVCTRCLRTMNRTTAPVERS